MGIRRWTTYIAATVKVLHRTKIIKHIFIGYDIGLRMPVMHIWSLERKSGLLKHLGVSNAFTWRFKKQSDYLKSHFLIP